MLFFRINLYLTIILISLCILTFSFEHNIVPEDLEHVQKEFDYLPSSSSNNNEWNQDEDMAKCMAVMRKYCNARQLPTAAHCVSQAILTWTKDVIPDGILKNYYLSFSQHRNSLQAMSRLMMTTDDYCERPSFDIQKCKDELDIFRGRQEDALRVALYETKLDEYCNIVDEEDGTKVVKPTKEYAFDYMLSIRRMILLSRNPYKIPQPLDFCHTISSNSANKDSPLDWTPYLN